MKLFLCTVVSPSFLDYHWCSNISECVNIRRPVTELEEMPMVLCKEDMDSLGAKVKSVDMEFENEAEHEAWAKSIMIGAT